MLEADAARAAAAFEGTGVLVSVTFERVPFGGLWRSRIAVIGDGATEGLNMVDLVQPRSARFAVAVLARAVEAPLRGQTIRVVAPEDFVLLKVISTRESDLTDAASVLAREPDALDQSLIEQEIGQLAEEIPDHDVRARWAHSVALSKTTGYELG